MKLLEVIIGSYFYYLDECKASLKISENNNYHRKKNEKLDLIKIKSLSLLSALFREWKANYSVEDYTYDKGLIKNL